MNNKTRMYGPKKDKSSVQYLRFDYLLIGLIREGD